jgi:hypothetical protein
MAEPIFRTVRDAQDYKNQEIARSKTAISRAESKLNDEVRKPFALFIQDNPTSLLQTEEDYNQFKSTYDDRTPRGSDYLTVYGREKGIDNGFNVTKIAPAWLGSSLDEVREFDPKTLKYNPEALDGAGGIEMQARVADKKNNRSFTAPITAAGKKVAELFGFGGKEAVEENTVGAFPETILDDMYDAYKDGIGIELLDPGIERLQRPSYTEARDLTFFDTSAGARSQREDYLFNLASGLEGSLAGSDTEPTEGSQEGAEPATSIVPTQKLSEEQLNFVLGNRGSFLAQRGKSGRTFKNEALPEELRNYVQTKGAPPFGITPEEFNSDKYSQDQRNRLLGRSKNLSDNNIFTAITAAVDPFFGPIDALKAQFGKRSTEDLEKRKEMQNVYKNGGVLNKQVLKDAFEINPNLLPEFQADPIAFADKYKNNLNLLSGTPVTTKQTAEVTKDSPFKVSKEDLNALREARENNNLTAYTEILNRIAGNTDIPDAQQQKVIDFLGQTNNFIRVKNDSQSRAAQNIVLDMWASMTREQRASYGGALMRFAETGYLTFEGVEQQRKIQQDIAERNKPLESDTSLIKFFDDFVDATGEPDYQFNYERGRSLTQRASRINTREEMDAFLGATGVYLREFFDEIGEPDIFDKILSFGQARGQAREGLSLSPNIIAYDAQFNETTDPEKAAYFGIREPGTRGLASGKFIKRSEVQRGAGSEAIPLLMEVSRVNQARRNLGTG